VVATAYVLGVSTRRVEKLAESLGVTQLSKSQVSAMTKHLDEQVAAFRNRPLDAGPYTFVWVDALTQKVREGGRIINVHALIAVGVNADGQREILGIDVATAEDSAGWLAFHRHPLQHEAPGQRPGAYLLPSPHRNDAPGACQMMRTGSGMPPASRVGAYATTRITVTLPTEQVAELRKLKDNVSGYVAKAYPRILGTYSPANRTELWGVNCRPVTGEAGLRQSAVGGPMPAGRVRSPRAARCRPAAFRSSG
jgi:hypothetical protein